AASVAAVRLGMDPVNDVVNRHDAPERPPRRRRAREAMHEVDAGAAGENRQERLLTCGPLDAPPAADRDDDGRNQLAESRVRRRLAVDEAREPEVWPPLQQDRDELARVGLEAAHLARDEVDEVEADVHQAPYTSTRIRRL